MFYEIKNLIELIYNSNKLYGSNVFLKYKKNDAFQSITYNEFIDLMESLAAALYDMGVRKNDKISLVADNCYKWMISDLAIMSIGAIDVPRGSDTTAQELSFILKHSDSKYCILEDPAEVDKFLSNNENIEDIKKVILMFGNQDEIRSENKKNIEIYPFDELIVKGKELKSRYADELKHLKSDIKEDDCVTIIYTSGTTGSPKGVMLSHKNIMQNVKAMTDVLLLYHGKESAVTILPIWHIFERTIEYIEIAIGTTIAYSKPAAKYLLPDLQAIKPTLCIAVPRIFEALYSGIMSNIKKESGLKQFMFHFFIGIGAEFNKAKRTLTGKIPLFKRDFFLITFFIKVIALFEIALLFLADLLGDILVFSTVRKRLGGRLRLYISGGGALPEHIDTFFDAVKIRIFEGYGMTETAPIIGVRNHKTCVPKTVGRPAPGLELMIGDDNWNKKANQHRKGEIYVKGDIVMLGYYKDPEKTAETIRDGWLRTGDLGRLTVTGEIQITGRAKDTIVLIGGENIEPEPIEERIMENPMIYQIMVVGQDRKTLGALIVPEKDHVIEFAKKNNMAFSSYEDLLQNKTVINEIGKILKNSINQRNGFKDFERISFFSLLPQQFEVGEELTNSFKMKRNFIAKKYSNKIDSLYGG
jgi:long-chain acyl-CoA synthetase